MTRFKLTLEYDGTPFVGWQIQENGISIQGQLKNAIAAMTGCDVMPAGAGRTDAGVHARGQVAHIDLDKSWQATKLREGLNYHLKPDPIAVLQVEEVDEEFDARFSAQQRHYRYLIINRRAMLTLDHLRAMHVPRPLMPEEMQRASEMLIGQHDFTTFRSIHCQAKSPVKTIDEISVQRDGDTIIIDCSARSFMHNQVRSIVGSLVEVGIKRWTVEDFKNALEACDRSRCGTVAPAHGLYFMKVDYAG